MPSLEQCLLRSSAHSLSELFFYCWVVMSCLCILEIKPLSVASFVSIFSHSIGCVCVFFFFFLMVSFAVNLGGSEVKPGFNPWVGKIPWRRQWQPTPVFLPGESHGQRSLVGCSPWAYKVSDSSEQLSTQQRKSVQHRSCFKDWESKETILLWALSLKTSIFNLKEKHVHVRT